MANKESLKTQGHWDYEENMSLARGHEGIGARRTHCIHGVSFDAECSFCVADKKAQESTTATDIQKRYARVDAEQRLEQAYGERLAPPTDVDVPALNAAEEVGLDLLRGNALYHLIASDTSLDSRQDHLKRAAWYLQRAIERSQ